MIDCVPPPPLGAVFLMTGLSLAQSVGNIAGPCVTLIPRISHTHTCGHHMGLYRPWQLSYTVLVNSVHTELVLFIQYHETGRLRKHASSGL